MAEVYGEYTDLRKLLKMLIKFYCCLFTYLPTVTFRNSKI